MYTVSRFTYLLTVVFICRLYESWGSIVDSERYSVLIREEGSEYGTDRDMRPLPPWLPTMLTPDLRQPNSQCNVMGLPQPSSQSASE